MAKKSSSGHHRPMHAQGKGAMRKPQAPEQGNTATLVRSPGAPTPSAANVVAESAPVAAASRAPEPRPAVSPAPSATPTPGKTAVAERPAASKPTATANAAPPARQTATTASREQNQRLARARATQRARQANLITAESYSYVLGDLKLVVGLAVTAFVVLIALTFVLPH